MQSNVRIPGTPGGWLLVLLLSTVPAFAQSVPELLEKGIYLEETAGQVEEAIEVYRRITGDATAGRANVAEALLRLGLCHQKLGDAAAATTAFKRVIADYPEQELFVARAREHLPADPDPEPLALLPAPWDDGEVMRLGLQLASGTPIGAFLLTADATELEGVPLWRLRTRHRVHSDADNQGIREVLARRDTMAPVRGTVRHSIAGHFEARYGDGAVTIETIGAGARRREKLPGPTFDSEELFHLFRRLPLEVGYSTRLSFISAMAGGATAVDVEVAGIEKITVPAGEFECYRVEISVPQVVWFSTEPSRVLVKFETSGIVGELQEVYAQEPGSEAVYADEMLGLSVNLPPDWLFHSDGNYPTEVLFLFDPNAESQTRMDIRRSQEEAGDCFHLGGAQQKLEQARRALRDYALRDGTWREWYFGGWPAVRFVGDYLDRDTAKVHYWTRVQNEEFCVDFTLKVAADRFDALRAVFDGIIESYQAPPPPPAPEVAASTAAAAVESVLADFDLAVWNADPQGVFEHLAPDAIFFGPGAADRFDTGALRERFPEAIAWLGEVYNRHVIVSDDQTLAWFDQRLRSAALGELRASGVLRFRPATGGQREGWQIVQYHVAMPVPNQLVPELLEKIRAYDQEVGRRSVDFSAPVEPSDAPAGSARWLLHDVHRAKAEGDGERYFGHFAPDGVFLGTDRSERFSLAGMRAILGPYYARGARPLTIPVEQIVYPTPDGGWAWFEQLVERQHVGRMRGTGVLRKVDDTWKFLHYNVVLIVPNALAEDFARRIEAFYTGNTDAAHATR